MDKLKVYTIGEDPLPVRGASILYWDSRTDWGVFESVHTKEDIVSLLGGDSELLDEDYDLSLDEDIRVVTCSEQYLYEGNKWMYCHEYYPIVGSNDVFPFQDKRCFDVAVEQGWCSILASDTVVGKTSEEDEEFLGTFEGDRSKVNIENLKAYCMQDVTTMKVQTTSDSKVWYIKWSGVSDYFTYVDNDNG